MPKYEKYVHGLAVLPVWRTPHDFYALGSSLKRWLQGAPEEEVRLARTRPVYTHGLLVHELVAADLTTPEGVRALGERIGYEWLGSYANARLGGQSVLTRWARLRLGVTRPGQLSSLDIRGKPLPTELPDSVLAKFAAGGQVLEQHRTRLDILVRELVRAAKVREAPSLTPRTRNLLRSGSLELAAEPPFGAVLRSTSGGWAYEFPSLLARVWFELFEAFEARPSLHLCPICQRLYVPRTAAQRRCQRAVYIWPDAEPIGGCAPLPRLAADRHRREYKRLAEALRRARHRHGEGSVAAQAARDAFDVYRLHHFGLAGRPPKGEAPVYFPDKR
jgi:hypothetical protein